jgi:hypothetical protein
MDRLGFNSALRPICFMTFPRPQNPNYETDHWVQKMPARAAELLAMRRGSLDTLKLAIFDSDWTTESSQAISRLPRHTYDSRQGASDRDGGFEFTFKAPHAFFKITVSIGKVPDIQPVGSTEDGVWAVDIATVPVPDYRKDSRCC